MREGTPMPAKMNHYDAAIQVCVDRVEEGRFSGRMASRRFTAPIPFTDVGNLLLQVEEVLNRQNFPQAFERARTFVPRGEGSLPVAADLKSGMTPEEVDNASGAVDTFRLYIITRRNATWQGFLEWSDGTRQEFSSALEFLKLTGGRLLPQNKYSAG